MKAILGYQNTKTNGEDLAITPYLFLVISKGALIQVYGIGICFGYWSFYFAFGFGLPKNTPKFINHSKVKKNEL